jgi:hypothetical protein
MLSRAAGVSSAWLTCQDELNQLIKSSIKYLIFSRTDSPPRTLRSAFVHTSGYVRIRQDTSGYVSRLSSRNALLCVREYVSIRQHTSAYVSIRQQTLLQERSALRSGIRQHTSAYVSLRQQTLLQERSALRSCSSAWLTCNY